jgi:orotate phosphoribosyltransferase
MKAVQRLSELLIEKLEALEFSTVLAPAMGGLVMGQEVARQTNSRYIFAEKVDDKLALRRGFKIAPNEKILVVEDVVTRGGRVQEAIDIIRKEGGHVAGIAVLVDRSNGQTSFDAPFVSLLELSFPTYPEDQLPDELAQLPVEKPGS